MRVLRVHSDALLSVLQVFAHNPLYQWSLDRKRFQKRGRIQGARGARGHLDGWDEVGQDQGAKCQDGRRPSQGLADKVAANGSRAEQALADALLEADRAMLRVQLKRDGRLQGRDERLGVHGQVHQLIEQAADPANLCRMYEGWAAWL